MKQVAFVLAVLFATTVFCQEESGEKENKLRFGIKAGMAVANMQSEYRSVPTYYSDRKLGGMVGILIRTPLGRSLYFQPELLMVGKGYQEQQEFYDARVDLTYIELPLNLLYKSKGGFFIGGGPAPSFLIGENIFYFGNQNSKEFDFGINVLAGYETPLGFSINLNYTHGLLNLTSDTENVTILRNRSFGITVGYLFQ
jgi:hypothetical protein